MIEVFFGVGLILGGFFLVVWALASFTTKWWDYCYDKNWGAGMSFAPYFLIFWVLVSLGVYYENKALESQTQEQTE